MRELQLGINRIKDLYRELRPFCYCGRREESEVQIDCSQSFEFDMFNVRKPRMLISGMR